MSKYLSLETKPRQDDCACHISSISIDDNDVVQVIGAIPHQSQIIATLDNVETFKRIVKVLETKLRERGEL